MAQSSMPQHNTPQHGTARHSKAQPAAIHVALLTSMSVFASTSVARIGVQLVVPPKSFGFDNISVVCINVMMMNFSDSCDNRVISKIVVIITLTTGLPTITKKIEP